MLSWLRRRRETAERIDAEADALIGELGVEAYAEARRREYESSNDAIALRWNRVALAVARKIRQAHRARYLNPDGDECRFRA